MKKISMILLVMLSITWSVVIVHAENLEDHKMEGGITNEQPISIGETIYSAAWAKNYGTEMLLDMVVYKYVGLENNTIKIERRDKLGTGILDEENPPQITTLSLPLNGKKQALLKIDKRYNVLPSKGELVITIVDDFNRIKVEELKS